MPHIDEAKQKDWNEKVSSLPSRQTTDERLLADYWEKKERGVETNEIPVEEPGERTEGTVSQTAEALRVAKNEYVRRNLKRSLTKKMKPAGVVTKTAFRFTISIILFAYVIQLVCALGSLVGFGLHGVVLHVRHETWYGKLLGKMFDFQDWLFFEPLGYALWIVVVVMTLVLFICYMFVFYLFEIDPLATTMTTFVTAVCLALNIFPVTNLFPWLVIWVCYILFSKNTKAVR